MLRSREGLVQEVFINGFESFLDKYSKPDLEVKIKRDPLILKKKKKKKVKLC